MLLHFCRHGKSHSSEGGDPFAALPKQRARKNSNPISRASGVA
jgi:hypothetical protein